MHDQHKLAFRCWWMRATRLRASLGWCTAFRQQQEAVYRRTFVNLPFTNGDDSWELPIPATYILDRDGTILYASANEDYTERPEPNDIILRCRGNQVAEGHVEHLNGP